MTHPYDSFSAWAGASAICIVPLLYLRSCLLRVLRRANVGTVPAWTDRIARRGARLTGLWRRTSNSWREP